METTINKNPGHSLSPCASESDFPASFASVLALGGILRLAELGGAKLRAEVLADYLPGKKQSHGTRKAISTTVYSAVATGLVPFKQGSYTLEKKDGYREKTRTHFEEAPEAV